MHLSATGRMTIGQARASAKGDLMIQWLAESWLTDVTAATRLRANSFRALARHPGRKRLHRCLLSAA